MGRRIRREALTRRIKSLLGRIAFVTQFYRIFFRNKAVIVLFHRVDDALARDPISCDRATFNAFCQFFGRYFIVVSLEELLDKLEKTPWPDDEQLAHSPAQEND